MCKKMEWIDITERYPDFCEIVLFTNGHKICGGEYNAKEYLNTYWEYRYTNIKNYVAKNDPEITYNRAGWRCDWCVCGKIHDDQVTHWMRLPIMPER